MRDPKRRCSSFPMRLPSAEDLHGTSRPTTPARSTSEPLPYLPMFSNQPGAATTTSPNLKPLGTLVMPLQAPAAMSQDVRSLPTRFDNLSIWPPGTAQATLGQQSPGFHEGAALHFAQTYGYHDGYHLGAGAEQHFYPVHTEPWQTPCPSFGYGPNVCYSAPGYLGTQMPVHQAPCQYPPYHTTSMVPMVPMVWPVLMPSPGMPSPGMPSQRMPSPIPPQAPSPMGQPPRAPSYPNSWRSTPTQEFNGVLSVPASPRGTPSPYPHTTSASSSDASYTERAKLHRQGSREVQEAFARMAPQELAAALSEIEPHIDELAQHEYGNYVVSSLAQLEGAHDTLLRVLLSKRDTAPLTMLHLMKHAYGCRVMQNCFQYLSTPKMVQLVRGLRNRVAEVACDKHGKYSTIVALKYSHTHESFIISEVAHAVLDLSMDRHGSVFLQDLINPGRHGCRVNPPQGPSDPEQMRHGADVSPIIEAFIRMGTASLEALALDPWANFVVSQAAMHAHCGARVIDALKPSLVQLARTDKGSHVVKNIVTTASGRTREEVRSILMAADKELRNHSFGHWVIQAIERVGSWEKL